MLIRYSPSGESDERRIIRMNTIHWIALLLLIRASTVDLFKPLSKILFLYTPFNTTDFSDLTKNILLAS